MRPNTCESSGCHAGLKVVEQIHPFAAVRCVDCHGGNERATDKASAHVPRPAGFGTTTDGRDFPLITGTHRIESPGAPFEKRASRVYRSELSPGGDDSGNADHVNAAHVAYRRFRNPGDLLAVQASCGQSGCHAGIADTVSRSLHATMAGFMSGVFYANGHPGASAGTLADFECRPGTPCARDADKLAKLAIVLPRGEALVDPNFDPTIPGTLPSITREVPRNDQALRNAKKSDSLGMVAFYVQTDCSRCHLYTGGSKAPGDYRSTGCTACHVVYRNEGYSESFDDTVPKDETNHPFKHSIARFAPIEQCAHCHNRGARHTQRILGFRERPQGDFQIPRFRILNENRENEREQDPVSGGRRGGFYPGPSNSEIDPVTGNLRPKAVPPDPAFTFGPRYFRRGDTIFGRSYDPQRFRADGTKIETLKGFDDLSLWRRIIRATLDAPPATNPFFITDEDRSNDTDESPPDVHVERGFACVDCHTKREMHGDGHLYTDRFNKTEITCESCHGTALAESTLRTRLGNPVKGLVRQNGTVSLTLNTTGETRRVPQLKEVIDSGRNPNALGPSHLLHGRVECYACHAKWHDQCNSCHMITDYTSTDVASQSPVDTDNFWNRSYMDNEVRNAAQGQPRFVTTFDQLILGINAKGKIQNFHTGGQHTLFANKVAGGGGSELNLSEGNFQEFGRCVGGPTPGGLCELSSDCGAGGACTLPTCADGTPFARPDLPPAEGQCKRCTGGTRAGQSCSLGTDCPGAGGGTCAGSTLGGGRTLAAGGRVCFGGANDGLPCSFDPTNPTENPDCPGGSCGVRMFNFVFTTIDNGRHLPSLMMNPIFPHTVRKIPRNCDSCHPTPGEDPLVRDQVRKAIGLGSGTARVVDPTAPGGFRNITITRRGRIFTNGKGDLSITNPTTGVPARNGDELLFSIDSFIDITFGPGGPPFVVDSLTPLRATTHVGTGPLDRTAIEKILNNPQTPQVPSAVDRGDVTGGAARVP